MFLPAAARLNRLRNFEVLEDRRLLTSHFGADVPGPLPSQSGPGQPLSVRVDAESSAASTFSVPIIEELTGNRLYQVQGAAQLESSQLIAVDISRTYAITGRFRTLDFGTAAVSLGFVAFDENQQSLGFRAAAASAEVVDGQWSMFVSDMVEGTGGQPHQFPAGTTHIRLAVNISPQTDQVTMQLDDVAIREVVELTTCNAGVNPVGDGVTNDAPALQTCIDGLSDGSTIYVPKDHEFLLNDQIFVGNHVSFLGQDVDTSAFKLDTDLRGDHDPVYGFWFNFGIHERYGDLLHLGHDEAYQRSAGTRYVGELANLKFVLTENAVSYRAINFHSTAAFLINHNDFDGRRTAVDAPVSWLSQHVVGAGSQTGYISINPHKRNGVIRSNELRLRQGTSGGEQIGLGGISANMLVEDNFMTGNGDDCVGVHQVDAFTLLNNVCTSLEGRLFVGSSTEGLIQGNVMGRMPGPDGVFALASSFLEITTEDSRHYKPSSDILVHDNQFVAVANAPMGFGMRIRGGQNVTVSDNHFTSHNGSVDFPNSTPENPVYRDEYFGIRLEKYVSGSVTTPSSSVSITGNTVSTFGSARAQIGMIVANVPQLYVQGNVAEEYDLFGPELDFGDQNLTHKVLTQIPDVPVVTYPREGDTIAGPITVSSTTTSPASWTEFFVNGESIGVDNHGADGWSVDWNSNAVGNGQHTLQVRTGDADGNEGESRKVYINVTDPVMLAKDKFQTGSFSGGTRQWSSGQWETTGDASVEQSNGRAARLINKATMSRVVDTTGYTDVNLAFRSRMFLWESNDTARVEISGDGVDWSTVHQFVDGQDDYTYRTYDVPLIDVPEQLHIRFAADLNNGSADHWHIDDVEVTAGFVQSANAAPVVSGESYTLNEDGSLSVSAAGVLDNDSDPEGDALSASLLQGPLHASAFQLAADGSFTYQPSADYYGDDQFVYSVNDGVSSIAATAAITVTAVNDAPVAEAMSTHARQETAQSLTVAASDVDGDPLTFSVESGPAHGELSGSGPQWVYTPDSGFQGPDSFTFVANDGTVDSNIATVSIDVRPNIAPLAHSQSVAATEDTSAPITLTGSDDDGDPLTYQLIDGPTHGVLGGVAPNLTYTPSTNFNGSDQIVFTVHDGLATSDRATVAIDVAAVNDRPIASAQQVTTNEDQATAIVLNGSDVEGGSLSFHLDDNPGFGTLAGDAPDFTYTPDADYHGTDTFTFHVSDGSRNSAPATVTIQVDPVNDAPVADGQVLSAVAGQPITVTLGGSDVDLDPLTYRVVDGPSPGSLSGTPPQLTYTAPANFAGQDRFTFVAGDGETESNPATIQINVVAQPPIETPVTLASDDFESGGTSGGSQQWSSGQWETSGNVNVESEWWLGDSAARLRNAASMTRSVDASGLANVRVKFQSRAYLWEADDTARLEYSGNGSSWTTAWEWTDGEDDFNYRTQSVLLRDVPSQLHLRFAAGLDDGSSDYWHIDDVVVIGVKAAVTNLPPTVDHDAYSVNEDQSISVAAPGVLANDSDPEGFSITATLVTAPAHAAAFQLNSNGRFTYQADPNYFGDDVFTYAASDGVHLATGTVSITVVPVNDAPVAESLSLSTREESSVAVPLEGSDVDGDTLAFELISEPTDGVLSGAAPNLVYTPADGFQGTDTFTYRVDDGAQSSNTATVSIDVAANVAPTASAQSAETNEDEATAITLTGDDANGDALTFEVLDGPAHGTLTGTAPQLYYTPASNYYGSDEFTFFVDDGVSSSAPATVSIEVTPINDAPVANTQSLTTNEDQSLPITLGGSDIDGDALSFHIAEQPASGTLNGTAANFTYVPATNFNGNDSFKFFVNDGLANSQTVSVTVRVNAVNDVPVAEEQALEAMEGTPLSVELTAMDVDLDPLTFQVVDDPSHGTLSGAAPNLTYTPEAGYTGPDSFTFVANDGAVDSAPATVSLFVAAGPAIEVPVLLASDDFQSRNVRGGDQQWSTGAWNTSGKVEVHNGFLSNNYQAQIYRTGSMERAVDATGLADVELTFRSRMYLWGASDTGRVEMSGDGATWTTVWQIGDGQDDYTYRNYRVVMQNVPANLHVRFVGSLNSTRDYWHIDDIELVGVTALSSAPAPLAANALGGAEGEGEPLDAQSTSPTPLGADQAFAQWDLPAVDSTTARDQTRAVDRVHADDELDWRLTPLREEPTQRSSRVRRLR